MEVRIDSADPLNLPGNILVRGDNAMKGYYKNEKATMEVFQDNSGWMNTRRHGTHRRGGYVTACGRSKTMIPERRDSEHLSEEIEQKLNNLPYVNESLVIDDGGALVALVHPDFRILPALRISTRKNLRA